MAYQFADGFDNYGNSYSFTGGYPWATVNGTCATSTADYRFTPPGSLPGACVNLSTGAYLRQNLSSNQATIIAGFGFKLSALPSVNNQDIFGLLDTGTYQVKLIVTANGALQFYRGSSTQSGTTAIGTASANGTIVGNTWYGVAVQIVIGTGTSGSVALYLNGNATATINSTGLNTSESGNAYATQVEIGQVYNNSLTCKYDDFYCFDNTGSFLNALLGGDARILTKMPASAGTYTNWTPNGLGSNFQNAAVQPPSTSDYNSSNTPGTQDSYTMQVASLGVAPYFVLARASMERDDAGTHTPSIFVRSGSTNSSGVTTPALTSSYLFYDAIFQNDPNTSIAWTASGADDAQVGITEG